ncbi:39S ribosomal protein L22, mitochondrial [Trichoplax sp. H2]|nr:39S ribosomal protein L22, mitochondrial [Trichoplax sp. H2]|eukprot:RDD39289.1 39S ribosomal protein L22, mitochondrial [Trichoplax sp. H2]
MLALKWRVCNPLGLVRLGWHHLANNQNGLPTTAIPATCSSIERINNRHLHTTSSCCGKHYLKKPIESYHESLVKYKVQFVPTIDNRLLQAKLAGALQHDYLIKHKAQPKVVIHASKHNIRGSPRKLNLLARLIRRMRVDDAIAQMQFSPKRLAKPILRVILQAKEEAAKEHNLTDPNQLFVEESTVGRGLILKGVRYHGKGRAGVQRTYYCHYFLKLKEGQPPKDPTIPIEHRRGHTKWMVTNMPPPKIVSGL